jgi:hypothetical protein
MSNGTAWLDDLFTASRVIRQQREAIIADIFQTGLTGPDEGGCAPFDASQYPISGLTTTFRFVGVINVSIGGQTATLELFNKTDGVTVATLTTTALTPTEVLSGAVTLPSARKLYGVRLSRAGGTASDLVVCKYAAIEVLYT